MEDAIKVVSGIQCPLSLVIVLRGELGLDEAAEGLERAGSDDALRRAALADAHVNAGAEHRGVDATGDITVEHEACARTGIADVLDELGVARAVEYGDSYVGDLHVLRLRERTDVVADRAGDVDDTVALVPRDDLVHVEDGARVVHAAAVRDGDHAESVLAAGGGEGGSIDGVDSDVADRTAAVTDMLAVVEHRGVVLLALTDDHNPLEAHRSEELAHRVDRSAVGGKLVTATDIRNRTDRGRLGRAHELHAEVAVGVEVEGFSIGAHHGILR